MATAWGACLSAAIFKPACKRVEQIGELLDLIARNGRGHAALEIDQRRENAIDDFQTRASELNFEAASVVWVGQPANQLECFQLVEPVGDAGAAQQQRLAEMFRRQGVRRPGA